MTSLNYCYLSAMILSSLGASGAGPAYIPPDGYNNIADRSEPQPNESQHSAAASAVTPTNSNEGKEDMQPWLLTVSEANQQQSAAVSVSMEPHSHNNNNNNKDYLTINTTEITPTRTTTKQRSAPVTPAANNIVQLQSVGTSQEGSTNFQVDSTTHYATEFSSIYTTFSSKEDIEEVDKNKLSSTFLIQQGNLQELIKENITDLDLDFSTPIDQSISDSNNYELNSSLTEGVKRVYVEEESWWSGSSKGMPKAMEKAPHDGHMVAEPLGPRTETTTFNHKQSASLENLQPINNSSEISTFVDILPSHYHRVQSQRYTDEQGDNLGLTVKHKDLFTSPRTEQYGNSDRGEEEEGRNKPISLELEEPDSESYTTIIPEKFGSHITEFYTENNYLDSTEGKGFEIINGWTYLDGTSEYYDNINNGTEPSEQFSSSGTIETADSLVEDIYNITTVVDVPRPNEQNYTDWPFNETTDLKENHHRSTTIAFPSILSLNDQVQFLKLEEQHSASGNNENVPIAKIGIYNPKRSNNVANLVTIIKENSEPSGVQEETADDEDGEGIGGGGGGQSDARGRVKQQENYSPHVLLTPNDLKTLAEILIHEKIMPVYHESGERGRWPLESVEWKTRDVDMSNPSLDNKATFELQTIANTTTNGTDLNVNELIEQNSSLDTPTINVINYLTNTTDLLILNSSIVTTTKGYEIYNSPNLNKTELVPALNRTDEETWAHNVLDKVTSNILVPLQGIVTVEPDTVTTTASYYNTDVTSTNVSVNDTSTSGNDDPTSTGVITDQRGATVQEKSDEINEQSLDDINTSRQIRIPEKSLLVNPLLSNGMLDDDDLLLLHNFFKKHLNTN